MEYSKYIIVEYMGCETPILFPSFVPHNVVAEGIGRKVISAGFFKIDLFENGSIRDDTVDIVVFGESTTLKVKPREVLDNILIERTLNNH